MKINQFNHISDQELIDSIECLEGEEMWSQRVIDESTTTQGETKRSDDD